MADGSSTKYSANYLDDISLTVACQPITLPYFENFDSYTTTTNVTGEEPTCWELVQEDVAMSASNRPQLFGKASYAHSGSYSLRLYYRGVYAMPALDESLEVPISQLQLDMYVRQPKTQNALEVGVWEDNGTFVPVATVNNQGTGVEHVVCSFAGYTGNGRRIAFRNVMADGSSTKYSANYLDDISITSIVNKSMDVTDTNYYNDTDMTDEMDVNRYLENVTLYPNPTAGLVHIDAAEVQKVECYTMTGQIVAVFNEKNDIDISQLATGVYMLRITLPQGVVMRKVVRK